MAICWLTSTARMLCREKFGPMQQLLGVAYFLTSSIIHKYDEGTIFGSRAQPAALHSLLLSVDQHTCTLWISTHLGDTSLCSLQAEIMPAVSEALSRIAAQRPSSPLRLLGEHLIKEAQKVSAVLDEYAHDATSCVVVGTVMSMMPRLCCMSCINKSAGRPAAASCN